ncbi:SIR2 family NAD-dependent protein deacylase [Luteimonas sp. SDU82]|uniref:SIR2 family NAD-dependent protein deacylase n=1 Tax=Luteimonas sp. SDU82 TaxID=3422592 RepID=UPI003EBD9784
MAVKEALERFFNASKLPILFAGAGVSAAAGLPTWPNYLSALAAAVFEYDEFTRFNMDRAIKDGALGDAATYYMMCRQMPEATKLRELARPLETFNPAPLSALAKLPFHAAVTTNYDRALFSAVAKYNALSATEVNIDDPSLDAAAFYDNFYIARIHGRVELPASMRLTTAALSEIEKNYSYTRFLEHILTRRQVLFLGFSFLDPAIETVLRSVRAVTKSMHRQEHLALVPSDAPNSFIAELEAHSIKRVTYSSDANHIELWRGISEYAMSASTSSRAVADVREEPFRVAKRYLATAFARARLGRQREPLIQAVAEGVVSGIVQSSGAAGIDEESILHRLRDDLVLDEDAARSLVAQSITSLARAGLCKVDTSCNPVRYLSQTGAINTYDAAMSRLTDGVIQRFLVTDRGTDSVSARHFVTELLSELLLVRGWELGAAFAARKMPADVDVAGISDQLDSHGMKHSELSGIVRSVKSLLTRPDDEEAELLADLGRTAFGLELLLEAPHDAGFLKRTLPERIYFDANVIMPAITPGHPHYDVFNQSIAALRGAAGSAVVSLSLRIYDGFLNEIVSHKQLAREAMRASNGEGALWEERSVGLYGSGNVNVFVGAYFNYRETHLGISFEEFLHVAAPYNSEVDLRRYLEKLGFEVLRDGQARKKGAAELLHALEKYYSGKLEASKKSAIVISHDAAQLAIVNAELHDGVRTMFVSADRGIRFALEYEGHSSISNCMLTHLGLSQLVELMVGRLPASRGLASLLWMSPVSDDTARIRSYLVALALREHDAALTMGMSEIVGEIAEDAGMELSRRKLSLDPITQSERLETNRTLERYETKFFEKLRAEAEKIRKRGVD